MKVFMIGGATASEGAQEWAQQVALLSAVTAKMVRSLASAGHQLLICSPFKGTVDAEVISSIAALTGTDDSVIQLLIYHPQDASVDESVKRELAVLSPSRFRTFGQRLSHGHGREVDWQYSWLLAQLAALDQCDAVIAIGGKAGRATDLLLKLAETRRSPILAFAYMDGAAAASLARRRYELQDRLGDEFGDLFDVEKAANASSLVERLVSGRMGYAPRSSKPKFFISYARERHMEADYVETILRRRHHDVFRDEHTFQAGENLPNAITENIHAADVFIAIWGREYACSPWCFDELDLALRRHAQGKLVLWILTIDGTRVVPPAARSLLALACQSREDLERHVIKQLEAL